MWRVNNRVRIMNQRAQHHLGQSQMFLARVVLKHFGPCRWIPFWRNFGKTIHMNLFEEKKQSRLLFHAPLCHRSSNSFMVSGLDMFLYFVLYLYVSCIPLLSTAIDTCRAEIGLRICIIIGSSIINNPYLGLR